MQQALAPAPHPAHGMVQRVLQENAAEQSAWFPRQAGPGAQAEFGTDLREHLLAQVQPSHGHGPASMANMRPSSSASPHDQNIDPAIAGPMMNVSTANDSGGDDGQGDGKKGNKRELSTSKRAAQNRAAQRAFRQRKEGYIKKLEEQVRDMNALEENYKVVQAENYQLRDYIINLQSRLIESQGEYPQPPSNIELSHPRQDAVTQLAAPTAPMVSSAESQLQASAAQAQAVAEMGNGNHQHEEAAAAAAAAAHLAATGNGYASRPMKNGEMDMSRNMPGMMMRASGGVGGVGRNMPMP